MTGRKDDTGKARWDLVPMEALSEVVDVLTHGAEKYGPENWRNVDQPRRRYYAALMRHVTQWWMGEERDEETGFHHLAHAAASALFLVSFDSRGSELPSYKECIQMVVDNLAKDGRSNINGD